ncbi:MAG: metallophosphoesterase [Alphaproteobacteria bacterium]|nr:metallophosphoesterase [Alphaproteobacteria bacterium]MCB9795643.1 metallophosphoesterase [Alphaproteobacteria bacterium]
MNSFVVISDLHLGGASPQMMSTPQRLADFIDRLSAPDDDTLELVINGDFVDFLAMPQANGELGVAWTPDPHEACAKLVATMGGQPAPVFDALGRHLVKGHLLTIILGNHDVELGLPQVQDALLRRIGGDRHRVHFVDDGRAYRVGGLLIEHGNRYDDNNLNDWEGLRQLASCLGRGERPPHVLSDERLAFQIWEAALRRGELPPRPYVVSAGSLIVERCVNPLKVDYPLLDLMQPQGVGIAFLLLELEPTLRRHLRKIGEMLGGGFREWTSRKRRGRPPILGRNVGADEVGERFSLDDIPPALEELYAQELLRMRDESSAVGAQQWIEGAQHLFKSGSRPHKDGIRALVEASREPPGAKLEISEQRLEHLRVLFETYLNEGDTLSATGPTEQYGQAAERMLAASADLDCVIMGHTHQARRRPKEGADDRSTYINTGTWADLITIPQEVLEPSEEGRAALRDFLVKLVLDEGVREQRPSSAEVRLNADRRVTSARLVQEERSG